MNKERDSKHPTRVRWNDPSSDLVFGGHPSLQLRATLPFMPDDMRLTAREVALIISPHSPQVATVYQLLKKGALRGIKVGKRRWFRAADVRAYFEGDVDDNSSSAERAVG